MVCSEPFVNRNRRYLFKGEPRSFISGEGEIELEVEKDQGYHLTAIANKEGKETSASCSSLESLKNAVREKTNLKGQRNEYFYWVISRAVELGVDEPFIDWLCCSRYEYQR